METPRSADTFVVRIRREPYAAEGQPPVERWQVEHVQTGLKVYVHGLDEAVAVMRSWLSSTHPKPHPHRPR
ncbi:MAG TPA: hypothetical protein VD969_23625 [Symbiobacteriaceae bacterium]|nr:hypothetical protein [Symbiobacteriaceae bacterium]